MDGYKNIRPLFTGFLVLFIVIFFIGTAQTPQKQKGTSKAAIEYADSSGLYEHNIQILRGNVILRHDSSYMYCDSAYFNDVAQTMEAFSNVRFEQGDTLFIYGNYLHYDANIQLAKLRNNVRMINRDVTLLTDSFNYDRGINVAYYFNNGRLLDSVNELKSVDAQYSPETKFAYFKNSVRLVNSQFTLTCDTLKYSTETRIAYIVSPTIIESDSGIIYTDKGWYNTLTEESLLQNRSLVVSKDRTKTITADSLFYNKTEGFIEAFGNMVLNDTVKKIILLGDYGYYNENTDFAFATDSAQMIEYSQRDSLFAHADTISMRTVGQEREIKAYYGVRFYRIDIQGVCDSLQFNTADSLLNMYKNPILWNTGYQINGDTIRILFNDSTIERMNVLQYSFAIQQLESAIDSSYFNQLKGKNMTVLFHDGEAYKMYVDGNAESIYYPIDEKDGSFMCLHKSVSSYINFNIKNRKPIRIVWYVEPDQDTLPIPDLKPSDKFLKDFINYDYLRPKSKEDIFVKVEMKKEDVPPPRRMRGQHKR
jgi:lipopolysaccharide assembly outer membrane protein LptD (OstA)